MNIHYKLIAATLTTLLTLTMATSCGTDYAKTIEQTEEVKKQAEEYTDQLNNNQPLTPPPAEP